jgi:hypothetical protein
VFDLIQRSQIKRFMPALFDSILFLMYSVWIEEDTIVVFPWDETKPLKNSQNNYFNIVFDLIQRGYKDLRQHYFIWFRFIFYVQCMDRRKYICRVSVRRDKAVNSNYWWNPAIICWWSVIGNRIIVGFVQNTNLSISRLLIIVLNKYVWI